jgi:hypothetical protein
VRRRRWRPTRRRLESLIAEPPTLISLGFEWLIDGDDNRNASVEVSYRRRGDQAWSRGLPLLRIGNERINENALQYVTPNGFAGSIFDLVPATEYEVRFVLTDADGVEGTAGRTVTVRTRAVPRPAEGGRVYHVYPPGHKGAREEPAFTGLLAAYYTGSSHSDNFNTFPPRVQPGDTILVHAGVYKDDRFRYGGGLGTVSSGTYFPAAARLGRRRCRGGPARRERRVQRARAGSRRVRARSARSLVRSAAVDGSCESSSSACFSG